MATFTWTGAAKDGDFLNPQNWKTAGQPAAGFPTGGDTAVIGNGDTVTLPPRLVGGKPLLDQKGNTYGDTIGKLTLSGGSKLVVQDGAALNFLPYKTAFVGPNGPVLGSIVARTSEQTLTEYDRLKGVAAPTTVDQESDLVVGKGSSVTVQDGGILRGAIMTDDPAKLIVENGGTLQNTILFGNWTPPNPGMGVATITIANRFIIFPLAANGSFPAPANGPPITIDLTSGDGVILKLVNSPADYKNATFVLGGKKGSGLDAGADKGGVTMAASVTITQQAGVASITGNTFRTAATINQTGGTLTVTAAKVTNAGTINVSGKGTGFVVGGVAGDAQTAFTNAAGHSITVKGGASLKVSDYAAVTNDGTITLDGGTAMFDALVKGSGTFDLGARSVATFDRGTGKALKLNFDSADAKVVVGKDGVTSFHATLTGAVKGDSITLDGVKQAQVTTAINGNTATVTVYDATDPKKVLTTFTIMSTAPIKAVDKTGNADTTLDLGCLVAGTLVATPAGARAVETLAAGDAVLACVPAGGVLAGWRGWRIRWIGRRTVMPGASAPWPVRIARDALAAGVPSRDLLVSPDHAVFFGGGLVQARQLVNGATVRVAEARAPVTYFHVELDRHALMLAEGLAVESYLDAGAPHGFEPVVARAAVAGGRSAGGCAPLLLGAEAEPAWRALAARASGLGMPVRLPSVTPQAGLHVLAGGRRLVPIARAGGWVVALPRGCRAVRLASRAAAPCETAPWLDDRRRLGVRVAALALCVGDGRRVIAADDPGLREGWWPAEHGAAGVWRWTDGDALVTLGEGCEVLEIRGSGGVYPVAAEAGAVAVGRRAG